MEKYGIFVELGGFLIRHSQSHLGIQRNPICYFFCLFIIEFYFFYISRSIVELLTTHFILYSNFVSIIYIKRQTLNFSFHNFSVV